MQVSGCDGAICFLGCLSLIPGATSHLVSRAAFFPPSPPGYVATAPLLGSTSWNVQLTVEDSVRTRPKQGTLIQWVLSAFSSSTGLTHRECHFTPLPRTVLQGQVSVEHAVIPCCKNRYAPVHAFYLRHPKATKTIIYSHGNSTDIGLLFPWLVFLVDQLEVSICAYDYTGYGASEGTPCEDALYVNIASVFEWITETRKVSPASLVLYGQSVGTVPSIHLARKTPQLAGVVVHSGMMSGLTVLKPGYPRVHNFDVFRNFHAIQQVAAPVFIIHGRQDQEIPLNHGESLAAAAGGPVEVWFVDGAGHNDIENKHRGEYLRRLSLWLKSGSKTSVNSAPAKSRSIEAICQRIRKKRNERSELWSSSFYNKPNRQVTSDSSLDTTDSSEFRNHDMRSQQAKPVIPRLKLDLLSSPS